MTTLREQRMEEIEDVFLYFGRDCDKLASLQLSKEVELLGKIRGWLVSGCIEECPHGTYPCEHCKTCHTGKIVFKIDQKIKERE